MGKHILPLSKIPENDSCIVQSLNFNQSGRRRILDLGIIPGTNIKVLQKSPLGDPTAYFIRGAVIALRDEDTQKIMVKKF